MAEESLEALIERCAERPDRWDGGSADRLAGYPLLMGLRPVRLAEAAGVAARLRAESLRSWADRVPTLRVGEDHAALFNAWDRRRKALGSILECLLGLGLPFTTETLSAVLSGLVSVGFSTGPRSLVVKVLERNRDLIPGSPLLAGLVKIAADTADNEHLEERLRGLLGERSELNLELPILPGEAWSDAVLLDLGEREAPRAEVWTAILRHCRAASSATPTKKWTAKGRELLELLGEREFADAMGRWWPLVELPRTAEYRGPAYTVYPIGSLQITGPHMEVLKGLCWLAGDAGSGDLARGLGRLAMSCYRKVPGVGPRAVKVGHAAVYALGRMEGKEALGQLAMLKVKVKFIPAQKGIEKALTAAAERAGLPREEIEELAVPTYGLTGVGVLEEAMGEFTARLTVTAVGETELVFVKDGGKVVKSVPASVKASHAEELKELKAAMKDIAAMLPAQKDRIDGLFLEQKTWAMATWRERYLDHPLTGILGRRLIWVVTDGPKDAGRAVTWLDGRLSDATGAPAAFNEEAAIVRLWHPLEAPVEGVMAWRRFFEERGIRQPFKQAHREVYVLTDAERRTGTYSNRYAAHVIRQHQFHALCAARGWRNTLRLMVDDTFPPASRQLARWGLRAEFWVEGAGDEYGVDTNESGAFLHLTTDQVRFYAVRPAAATGGRRAGADTGGQAEEQPLALDRVPPLVFSEIMRDVDLFVGVASVGNNPEWQDGGPENRYREYWWHYGFGELSGTAQTRRELLGRLLPRLKIAGVCTLSDRFLTVKGKIREYKIHLGSGNILMAPNDQYLCIVPTSRDDVGGIHLPFDGDRVLSIILSKAFMLAEDDTIKDGPIVSQIQR